MLLYRATDGWWIETAPGKYERRRVAIGLEQDGQVLILSGLADGERVVTKGAVFLSNAVVASAK